MDPIATPIAFVISGFIQALGPRIAQGLFPSPFDRAQVIAIETQRQRLIDEESRFQRQMTEARENLLHELQHRRDMLELQEQLRRWQFNVLPSDFIRRSKMAGGSALNIILRISDHRRVEASKPDRPAMILKEAIMNAEDRITTLYAADRLFPSRSLSCVGNGVLLYADYRLGAELPIQAAVTTLSSLLASEPVVLVDIAIRDQLRYRVTLSHWGDAMGGDTHAVTQGPQTLDLFALVNSAEQAASALSASLLILLVGLCDNFHLMRHNALQPKPALPEILRDLKGTRTLSGDWSAVLSSYEYSINAIGIRAPMMAIDMAAGLAIEVQRAGLGDTAALIARWALGYFGLAYRMSDDPQQIMNRLVTTKLGDAHSDLKRALRDVLGIKHIHHPGRTKLEAYRLLNEQ